MGPDAGIVRIGGMNPLSADPKVRSVLGYMPQQYSLYGDLSVDENLSFFGSMFCLSKAEFFAQRERLLDITRLSRFTDRRADALSGGMYKKLALACSLLPKPQVLLLDEPTNGVDPVSRRELWALLFELVEDGMAVVVSTAYMDEAERCHRVGLLFEGRLRLEGPPQRLLAEHGRAGEPFEALFLDVIREAS
jgi:ABC-2 type transport system ATP-binding protein